MTTNLLAVLIDVFVDQFQTGEALVQFLGLAYPDLRQRGRLPYAGRPIRDVAFDSADLLLRGNRVDAALFERLVEREPGAEAVHRAAEVFLGPAAAGALRQQAELGDETTTFTLLHLSDRHFGQADPRHRWPATRAAFFADLRPILERTGRPDAVVFTGDLVMMGRDEEYDDLSLFLEDLSAELPAGPGEPVFVSAAGNHDLSWPQGQDPLVRELLHPDTLSDRRAALLADPASPERALVEQEFAAYRSWWGRTPVAKLSGWQDGLLPGEGSGWLEKDGVRLGFVVLNTAALHNCPGSAVPAPAHPDEPFKGRMMLDPAQFHAACSAARDGERWLRREVDAALLLTHHGPDWLTPRDQAAYYSSIYRPGSFLAHLYGHVHGSALRTLSSAGEQPRRHWQGHSLFGVEEHLGREDRAHGYAVVQVRVTGVQAEVVAWPRAATEMEHGSWSFRPDPTLETGLNSQTAPVVVPVQRR